MCLLQNVEMLSQKCCTKFLEGANFQVDVCKSIIGAFERIGPFSPQPVITNLFFGIASPKGVGLLRLIETELLWVDKVMLSSQASQSPAIPYVVRNTAGVTYPFKSEMSANTDMVSALEPRISHSFTHHAPEMENNQFVIISTQGEILLLLAEISFELIPVISLQRHYGNFASHMIEDAAVNSVRYRVARKIAMTSSKAGTTFVVVIHFNGKKVDQNWQRVGTNLLETFS